MARAQHRQKHAQIRIVRTESHYIGNSRFRLAAELRRSLNRGRRGCSRRHGPLGTSEGECRHQLRCRGSRYTRDFANGPPGIIRGNFLKLYRPPRVRPFGFALRGRPLAVHGRAPRIVLWFRDRQHGRPGRLFRRGGPVQALFRGRAFARSDAIAYGIGLATITGTMRDATARFEELRALRRQLALHSAADRTDSDNSRS